MQETKDSIAEYYAMHSKLTVREASQAVEKVFDVVRPDAEAERILKSHGDTDLELYLKVLEELTAFGVDPQLIKEFCGHVEKTWQTQLKIKKDSPHVSLVVEMDPEKWREIYLRTVEP